MMSKKRTAQTIQNRINKVSIIINRLEAGINATVATQSDFAKYQEALALQLDLNLQSLNLMARRVHLHERFRDSNS